MFAEHRDAGVHVYTVSPASLPSVRLLESYTIVDDRVPVTFQFTRDGGAFREERVSIDPVEVGRAAGRFESIRRRARPYARGDDQLNEAPRIPLVDSQVSLTYSTKCDTITRRGHEQPGRTLVQDPQPA